MITGPGEACQTCKNRKIKCDGVKPVCNRCSRSRRICLAASKVKRPVFAIHDETGYASGVQKRPRGPRPGVNKQRVRSADLHTLAHAYYRQYHLQSVPATVDLLGGLPRCVDAWTASGRRSDIVDLAFSTMALAVYGRTQQEERATTEAAKQYDRLVRTTSERVKHVEVVKTDAETIDTLLLTIFFLSRIESVMYQPGTLSSKDQFKSLDAWFHHDAAHTLLKIWIDDHDQHTLSPLVMYTRRGLMRSSILRHRQLPDWMLDGALFGERGPALEHDKIYVRVINLWYNFVPLKNQASTPTDKLEALGNEAREIDQALDGWAAHLPRSTLYRRQELTLSGPFPRDYFYSPAVLTFSSLGDASLWSHFFSTKMMVNSLRLRVYKLLRLQRPDLVDDGMWTECSASLQKVATDLAAAIPFCLERVFVDNTSKLRDNGGVSMDLTSPIKPFLTAIIIWPLSIAVCLEEVAPSVQQWFRSEFARLGKVTGDAILEAFEREGWPEL